MAEITSPPAKGANRLNHESDEIGQGGGGCLANLDIIFKMVYHHISAQYPRGLDDNM